MAKVVYLIFERKDEYHDLGQRSTSYRNRQTLPFAVVFAYRIG